MVPAGVMVQPLNNFVPGWPGATLVKAIVASSGRHSNPTENVTRKRGRHIAPLLLGHLLLERTVQSTMKGIDRQRTFQLGLLISNIADDR